MFQMRKHCAMREYVSCEQHDGSLEKRSSEKHFVCSGIVIGSDDIYWEFGGERYFNVLNKLTCYCCYDLHKRLGVSINILQAHRRLSGK